MAQVHGFTPAELTGRSRDHVVVLENPPCTLHREVVGPFLAMRQAAAAEGIDLVPVSSFRDFGRQLAIWNGKHRGERELLDVAGQALQAAALDDDARVSAILNWSALPGASRHHWGTDFDVIDAAAMPPGYRPRLVPEEYAPGGVFERLGAWLDANLHQYGFFRPYATWRGGAQPEPWHLSHAVVAGQAERQFSVEMLRDALDTADPLEARAVTTQRLAEIFARYVRNVDAPPAAALIPATRPG